MKSLVIYDSNYGNTQKVAETIATEIGGEAIKTNEVKPGDLQGLDVLVVGTPIIGWKPTVTMQAFLDALPSLEGVRSTTFDTRVKLFIHGDAMVKVAGSLKSKGAKIITPPTAFHVAGPQQKPYLLEGELERAQNWGREIGKLIN
jgi:flavodoxin